jgi:type II secretory pathway component PulC
MTKPLSHRIGPLLRLSALLAGILAFEIMSGPLMPEDPQASSGRTEKPFDSLSDTPLQSPAISTFAEIVERPLFTQSRRPPPKKDTKVATAAQKPETFELIGVIISPAGRMALLRTLATSEIVRAVEGQTVGGWEVRAIKPTQVVLQQGDDSEVLKINDATMTPAAKNPSAPNIPAVSDATPG